MPFLSTDDRITAQVDAVDNGSGVMLENDRPSPTFDTNDTLDSSQIKMPLPKTKPPLLTRQEMKLLAATMGKSQKRAKAMPVPQVDSTPSRTSSQTVTSSAANPRCLIANRQKKQNQHLLGRKRTKCRLD